MARTRHVGDQHPRCCPFQDGCPRAIECRKRPGLRQRGTEVVLRVWPRCRRCSGAAVGLSISGARSSHLPEGLPRIGLEEVVHRASEDLCHVERQRKGGIVLAVLNGDDGLPCNAEDLCQFLLRDSQPSALLHQVVAHQASRFLRTRYAMPKLAQPRSTTPHSQSRWMCSSRRDGRNRATISNTDRMIMTVRNA